MFDIFSLLSPHCFGSPDKLFIDHFKWRYFDSVSSRSRITPELKLCWSTGQLPLDTARLPIVLVPSLHVKLNYVVYLTHDQGEISAATSETVTVKISSDGPQNNSYSYTHAVIHKAYTHTHTNS